MTVLRTRRALGRFQQVPPPPIPRAEQLLEIDLKERAQEEGQGR